MLEVNEIMDIVNFIGFFAIVGIIGLSIFFAIEYGIITFEKRKQNK
jgi:hypothetical protein